MTDKPLEPSQAELSCPISTSDAERLTKALQVADDPGANDETLRGLRTVRVHRPGQERHGTLATFIEMEAGEFAVRFEDGKEILYPGRSLQAMQPKGLFRLKKSGSVRDGRLATYIEM
jgi:hypothetical protein